MASRRFSDNVKVVLLVISLGAIFSTTFYLLGDYVWAWIGLGFIPFAFGCWGLSWLLQSSHTRDLFRNLTDLEREQLNEMSRALGWTLSLRMLVVLVPVTVIASSGIVHFGPERVFDYLSRNQLLVTAAALVLAVVQV